MRDPSKEKDAEGLMPRDPSLPETQLLEVPEAASEAATLEQSLPPKWVKRMDGRSHEWAEDDDPTVVDRPPMRRD